MSTVTRSTQLRAARLTVLALTSLAVSWADVIQNTVELPPPLGAYSFGSGVCISALNRCAQNPVVFGFNVINRQQVGGNEVVDTNATYSADIFTNNGGVPGVLLGHLMMTGTAQFTYFGRNPAIQPLGPWPTELTDFDFQGTLLGNTFEVKIDSTNASTGTTTILFNSLGPPVTYIVSGSLDVFALYSLNSGAFTAAPPRTATLIPSPQVVPEPASGALAGSLLAGMAGIASRRRLRAIRDREQIG